MLIHDAELQYIGPPDETALRYYRLNFGGDADEVRTPGTLPDVNVRVLDAWLQNAAGRRITNVEQNERLYFGCVVEARRDLHNPVFGFHFMDRDGARLFGFNKQLDLREDVPDQLLAGQRAYISGEIENRLLPGRYHIVCWISRNRTSNDLALHALRLLDFMVYGTQPGPGSLHLSDDVRAELLPPGAEL
jgi:hypothetical protein